MSDKITTEIQSKINNLDSEITRLAEELKQTKAEKKRYERMLKLAQGNAVQQ